MIFPKIINIDLNTITAWQFKGLLDLKMNETDQAAIILECFLEMLNEGWSVSYARKCLKIQSTVIPCMEMVRKNWDYRQACERFRKDKKVGLGFVSQKTDLPVKRKGDYNEHSVCDSVHK